jgi:thioredoxin 1
LSAPLIHLVDAATFEAAVIDSQTPVVVKFFADWCPPCRALTPEMEKFAQRHLGAIDVVEIDIDASPELAQRYNVMSIPAVFLFENGDQSASFLGFKTVEEVEIALGVEAPAA